MGIPFNPNFPDQIGNERHDSTYDAFSVDTNTAMHALQFRALQTAAVSNVELFGGSGTSAPTLPLQLYGNKAPLFVDMYPISGAPYINPATVQLDTFNVSAVTGSANMYNEDLTQPITASRITTAGDGLFLAAGLINASVRIQFPTQAFPLDRRIIGVRFLVKATAKTELRRIDTDGSFVYNYTQPLSGGPGFFPNWTPFTGDTFIDGPTQPTWSWWTPQRVRDFKAGGPRQIMLLARGASWGCDTVRMEVMWVPETRIGVGITDPLIGWVSFPMKSPATTGTPTITSGQDYTLVLRRPVADNLFSISSATMTWRRLKGWQPVTGSPPITGWGSVDLTVQSVVPTGSTFLTPPSIPTIKKSDPIVYTQDVMSGRMTTGGPAQSGGIVTETSQPYSQSRTCVLHVAQGVISAHTASQTIVVTGAATSKTYGQTSAVVGWNPATAPLLTDIIRAEVWTVTGAPEARIFSPVDRTFADIFGLSVNTDFPATDEGGTTRLVRFRHPESRILPAGKYELRFSSPNALPGRPWRIAGVLSVAHTVDQTYGRSNEVGSGFIPSGSTYVPLTGTQPDGSILGSDLQATLMTVPVAVTGVGASVGVMTAHHATSCAGILCQSAGCSDEGSPYVELTWSASSDTLTDRYEIQRSDLVDDVFRSIAIIRGRFTTMWRDHEARIGVRSCYRIRSIRADGVAGDWSASTCASPQPGQISLTFTSNAATGMALTYAEVWSSSPITREFTFGEYDDVDFIRMYGRERQVAFHPRERRGVTFTRTILFNAICTVTPPTMGIFVPLRALTWAAVPYVCVRDGEGNRWFANVRVPGGTNVRGGEQWYGEIVVTEVSAVPAVIDTIVEQVSEELVP